MKEPGQLAYESHEAGYANQPDRPWRIISDDERAIWASVESAIRADEAAKVRAENERLREALEPFTRSLEIQESEWRMRDWPELRKMDRLAYAMVGDARRARAALEQKS
jgi:hypothetical protein